MGNNTSKKKSYTEDVVLNKILKDISEENLENDTSSQEHTTHHSYEDDLIKLYRKKDAEEQRQTYINIVKIIAFLSILIILIFIFTNYIDTIIDEPEQVKKTVTPTPLPKVIKPSKPMQVETVIIEPKKIIPPKNETKEISKTVVEEPVKDVRTEREIAKEMLLQQMKN